MICMVGEVGKYQLRHRHEEGGSLDVLAVHIIIMLIFCFQFLKTCYLSEKNCLYSREGSRVLNHFKLIIALKG